MTGSHLVLVYSENNLRKLFFPPTYKLFPHFLSIPSFPLGCQGFKNARCHGRPESVKPIQLVLFLFLAPAVQWCAEGNEKQTFSAEVIARHTGSLLQEAVYLCLLSQAPASKQLECIEKSQSPRRDCCTGSSRQGEYIHTTQVTVYMFLCTASDFTFCAIYVPSQRGLTERALFTLPRTSTNLLWGKMIL